MLVAVKRAGQRGTGGGEVEAARPSGGWAATSWRQSFGLVARRSITLTDSRSSESRDDYSDDVATSAETETIPDMAHSLIFEAHIHMFCAHSSRTR